MLSTTIEQYSATYPFPYIFPPATKHQVRFLKYTLAAPSSETVKLGKTGPRKSHIPLAPGKSGEDSSASDGLAPYNLSLGQQFFMSGLATLLEIDSSQKRFSFIALKLQSLTA